MDIIIEKQKLKVPTVGLYLLHVTIKGSTNVL